MNILELYAGPGGMSEGLRMLGMPHIGIEYDEAACQTAMAAGHLRMKADILTLNPVAFGPVWGMHGSPPCQGWSRAGKQKGYGDLEKIDELLHRYAAGEIRQLAGDYEWDDDRSVHVAEVMRWIAALRPTWVTLEQVPGVLIVWEMIAEILRAMGYSVWTGFLSAEEYGVPQTRKRAFLIANNRFEVLPPAPTHRKYRKGVPRESGEQSLKPWISMAEALGWIEPARVGFPRRADDAGEATDDGYRDRDFRGSDEPAFAMSSKGRSWRRFGVASHAAGVTGESRPRDPFDAPHATLTGKGTAAWSGDVAALRQGPNKNATVRKVDEPAATVFFGKDPSATEWVND